MRLLKSFSIVVLLFLFVYLLWIFFTNDANLSTNDQPGFVRDPLIDIKANNIQSHNPFFNSIIVKMSIHNKEKRLASENRALLINTPRLLDSTFKIQYKVLSYSLFGEKALEKYSKDLETILEQSAKSSLYRTWKVMIYTDVMIPEHFLNRMREVNARASFINITEVKNYPNLQNVNARTWRFLPISDPRVDIACIRDLDSDLYKREEAAVREFLHSDKLFHAMRDNPWHTSKIMGGLWCFRNSKNRALARTLLTTIFAKARRRVPDIREAPKADDQKILNHYMWPIVSMDAMVHDSFFCRWKPNGRPFPTRRLPAEPFVGCASRPCKYDFEKLKCPKECRPKEHQDWKYC